MNNPRVSDEELTNRVIQLRVVDNIEDLACTPKMAHDLTMDLQEARGELKEVLLHTSLETPRLQAIWEKYKW